MTIYFKPTALICSACGTEMGFGFDESRSTFDHGRVRCISGGCPEYHKDYVMPSQELDPWVSPADRKRAEMERERLAAIERARAQKEEDEKVLSRRSHRTLATEESSKAILAARTSALTGKPDKDAIRRKMAAK